MPQNAIFIDIKSDRLGHAILITPNNKTTNEQARVRTENPLGLFPSLKKRILTPR
jgi:hypothetical protein